MKTTTPVKAAGFSLHVLLAVFLPLAGCLDWNGLARGYPDDAGPPNDAIDMKSPCLVSLSNVGTGDFTVRFDLLTEAAVTSTIVYQRTSCDATHDLWDVSLTRMGFVRIGIIEVGGMYTDLTTNIAVNDGRTHAVIIRRVALNLSTTTDGNPSGSAAAPQKLTLLPQVGVGSGNPCEGAGGLSPLSQGISNVCLTEP